VSRIGILAVIPALCLLFAISVPRVSADAANQLILRDIDKSLEI
jgi:hypothetical protein